MNNDQLPENQIVTVGVFREIFQEEFEKGFEKHFKIQAEKMGLITMDFFEKRMSERDDFAAIMWGNAMNKFEALDQGLEELRQDVNELKQDVSGLKQGVYDLKQGQDKISRELNSWKGMTVRHEVEIDRLDERMLVLEG